MKSSRQVERECEQARASFAQTLDELRARATPGQLVDEAIDYVRATNNAAFFRNLGQQIVDNPLPVALVGTGFAWLMIQNGRTVGRSEATDEVTGAGNRLANEMGRKAREGSDRVQSATGALSERAREAASGASGIVAEAKDSVA
jgi:hypothetical protein